MPEPITYWRARPPAHYSLTINQFSSLSKSNEDKYESGVFEASGYKWSLSLYPNGHKGDNGSGYISLYLSIMGKKKLPRGWKVDVNFKLFVYNGTQKKYLIMQVAQVRTFHESKARWGFPQFLSLETFKKPSNGYLVDDSCKFGAEVVVIKRKRESLTMIKDPPNKRFTWRIPEFSELDKRVRRSNPFTVGESNWMLQLYPKGYGDQEGKSLSVYLELLGAKDLPPERKVYHKCNLRVLGRPNKNHKEKQISHWFKNSDVVSGYPDFMSLEDLHEPAKGFVHNDLLIVEFQFLVGWSLTSNSK